MKVFVDEKRFLSLLEKFFLVVSIEFEFRQSFRLFVRHVEFLQDQNRSSDQFVEQKLISTNRKAFFDDKNVRKQRKFCHSNRL